MQSEPLRGKNQEKKCRGGGTAPSHIGEGDTHPQWGRGCAPSPFGASILTILGASILTPSALAPGWANFANRTLSIGIRCCWFYTADWRDFKKSRTLEHKIYNQLPWKLGTVHCDSATEGTNKFKTCACQACTETKTTRTNILQQWVCKHVSFAENYAVRFNVSSCRLTNSILLFTNFPTGPCTYSLTGNTFNKNHIYHNYINCSASMLTVRHEAHNNRYNSLSLNPQVTT